jgi:hypothetical protein
MPAAIDGQRKPGAKISARSAMLREALAAVGGVRLSVGTVGQFGDLLPLIDDVQPVREGRGMMAAIVQTKNRQQERGGLLPNTALQAGDHLGRFAPSVARR